MKDKFIGSKGTVGFDIGSYWIESSKCRYISIWVGKTLINPEDNLAYLPAFIYRLKIGIQKLKEGEHACSNHKNRTAAELFMNFGILEKYQVLNFDLGMHSQTCAFVANSFGNGKIICGTLDECEQIEGFISIEITTENLLSVLEELLEFIC